MTTFNNALANLQNNSNRMAALAKGYNTDVAKFNTKKPKIQLGYLCLLVKWVKKFHLD